MVPLIILFSTNPFFALFTVSCSFVIPQYPTIKQILRRQRLFAILNQLVSPWSYDSQKANKRRKKQTNQRILDCTVIFSLLVEITVLRYRTMPLLQDGWFDPVIYVEQVLLPRSPNARQTITFLWQIWRVPMMIRRISAVLEPILRKSR